MDNKKINYRVGSREVLREKVISFRIYKESKSNEIEINSKNITKDYILIKIFIESLEEREKEIFAYRYLENLNYDRISYHTNLQVGSCQKIERKIIDKFSKLIKEYYK